MSFLLLLILPMALGFWAQRSVLKNFRRYSEVPSTSGMTGREVAERILAANGIGNVTVEHVPGEMSDHYDPRSRVVRLSDLVYSSSSISAVSVAAHEVGHAIQHAKAYAPMKLRSAFAPAAAFTSGTSPLLLMAGIVLLMIGSALGKTVLAVALALYALVVLFHFVTLPVEFDASRRARQQLVSMGLVTASETGGTGKVLNSAAMTYVAAALASLGTLLYYLQFLMGGEE